MGGKEASIGRGIGEGGETPSNCIRQVHALASTHQLAFFMEREIKFLQSLHRRLSLFLSTCLHRGHRVSGFSDAHAPFILFTKQTNLFLLVCLVCVDSAVPCVGQCTIKIVFTRDLLTLHVARTRLDCNWLLQIRNLTTPVAMTIQILPPDMVYSSLLANSFLFSAKETSCS